MKKLVVILTFVMLSSLFGGCAVIPAIVSTGASFAVPQTASVAITAVGTAHKTVLIAADERDVDDMISDKMLTIQAQAILLGESGTDMEATCLNGEIYVAGEYETPSDRDSAVKALSDIDGVRAVKGVIKQMPTSLTAMVEPTIRDKHAESVIETGLLKELHVKSANVDVVIVQGEAVIVGVVKDAEEARSVVQIVKNLRPKSENPVSVTSLLALQEAFDAGATQPNELFALKTQSTMLAEAMSERQGEIVAEVTVEVVEIEKPSMTTLSAYVPTERSSWQKARLNMKHRILDIAKSQQDKQARRELITLSSRVLKDAHISIEDRLIRTLNNTNNERVRHHVNSILFSMAPERAKRINTLAMN